MLLGSLVISRPDWLWPAVLLVAVAALGMLWGYRGAVVHGTTRFVCALLKVLGLLALTACLLEPVWVGHRAKPGANFIAVVADNSQSLGVKDAGAELTRGQWLKNLLAPSSSPWQQTLEEHFQLRRYLFDTRLQGVRNFSELTFDGRASAIGVGLQRVADRFRGQPLAGVLLFTDGNATDLPDGHLNLNGLPPVYPVVLGRDQAIKDISLQTACVTQTAFEDAPVVIEAEVSASGYQGSSVVARLLDEAGQAVQEQTQRAPRDGATTTFRFQVRPEKRGLLFYRLQVCAKDELEQFSNAARSTEATLVNNSRMLVVDRGQGPYRILYVSGRPNWEYKFLNRAVAEDPQVQLIGLIRIARREPKFEFRGRSGESSNPLYRGFDRRTEETERYDQPVLIRLNPKDATELAGGFPKTAEDLYAYDAVVVDDLEAEFFTRDQLTLLQKFVSERGGGFLMLGGPDSFQSGKYQQTPVGDMLPVYLDRAPEAPPAGDLRLKLTREGWLEPWARLRSNEVDEKNRLEAMAPFQVINPAREVKPGASVSATVTDAHNRVYPALVTQRFGHGRVGALLVGDFWHGGLPQESMQQDLKKAWRQMLRWLVADVPRRMDLQATPVPGDPHQAVRLQIRARDRKFQPLDNATVILTVRSVLSGADRPGTNQPMQRMTGTNFIRLTAEPALTEPGLYQATFVPRDGGGYLAEAIVTDTAGVDAGRAQTGWSADPAAEEFRSLRPNRALLEAIARQTGGEVISPKDLDGWAARLPRRDAPIAESWSLPLWHQSAVFLFALLCLVAEWGLRRWRGMA